jgi:hypothetical protein
VGLFDRGGRRVGCRGCGLAGGGAAHAGILSSGRARCPPSSATIHPRG